MMIKMENCMMENLHRRSALAEVSRSYSYYGVEGWLKHVFLNAWYTRRRMLMITEMEN